MIQTNRVIDWLKCKRPDIEFEIGKQKTPLPTFSLTYLPFTVYLSLFIFLFFFCITIISFHFILVSMKTTGDKILETALAKVRNCTVHTCTCIRMCSALREAMLWF